MTTSWKQLLKYHKKTMLSIDFYRKKIKMRKQKSPNFLIPTIIDLDMTLKYRAL
jgi:hypothetical protein